MKYLGIAIVALVCLLSCKQETEPLPILEEDERYNVAFDSLLVNYNKDFLKLHPLVATQIGDTLYNDTLPNILSERYRVQLTNFCEDYQRRLNNYKENTMSVDQIISRRLIAWECEMTLVELGFPTHLVPLNQFSSLHHTMAQLAAGTGGQPFKTARDYENWTKRVSNYVEWIKSALVRMDEGIKKGHVLPKTLVVKLSSQLKDFANPKIEEHILYKPYDQIPPTISSEKAQELKDNYAILLKDKVIPTYKQLYEFVTTEYLKKSRNSSGLSDLPRGKELYNHYVKYYTTTDLTADQIHEQGLKEVKRIKEEMKSVMKEVGFQGTLKEFNNHIRDLDELKPFNSPEAVVANFNSIHQRIKPNLDKLFSIEPKTDFVVKRTESFREASASAGYVPGSLDGSIPGTFYVPIPDYRNYNTFTDESLFLHEAIPGHHYQVSLQQENDSLPAFRRYSWYSSYGEGWALYCESLGKELGLYEDPYQYYGKLSAEMHRAIRLVVDTGIHAKGWSREKAIEYSLENEASSLESIESEVERYMAIPGQALSYKIGELKIKELRRKAKKKLGSKFDISEFHTKVLESGSLPLKLLEEKINNWIRLNE